MMRPGTPKMLRSLEEQTFRHGDVSLTNLLMEDGSIGVFIHVAQSESGFSITQKDREFLLKSVAILLDSAVAETKRGHH